MVFSVRVYSLPDGNRNKIGVDIMGRVMGSAGAESCVSNSPTFAKWYADAYRKRPMPCWRSSATDAFRGVCLREAISVEVVQIGVHRHEGESERIGQRLEAPVASSTDVGPVPAVGPDVVEQ
jgi:hypothetical protein